MSFTHSTIFRDEDTGMIYGSYRDIESNSCYNDTLKEEYVNEHREIYTGSFKHFSTPTRVKSIDYGEEHVVFCGDDGSLWTAGCNGKGALGLGEKTKSVTKFTLVEMYTGIIQVSAGIDFSIVLDNSGCVWSFGNNEDLCLGIPVNNVNSERVQFFPAKISSISDIQSIYSCSKHTLALGNNSTQLWIWGYLQEIKRYPIVMNFNPTFMANSHVEALHQAHTSTFPVYRIFFDKDLSIKSVATARYFSLLLDYQNNVWMIGIPNFAYSGFSVGGPFCYDGSSLNYPREVCCDFPVKSIHCGVESLYLVREDGEIMVAGRNSEDELGIKSELSGLRVFSSSESLKDMTILSTRFHTLICKDSYGYVHSAGFNKYGQTGKSKERNSKILSCTGFRLIPNPKMMKSSNTKIDITVESE